MESIQDLNPDSNQLHKAIFGKSGSGKSALSAELHRHTPTASIYFNYPRKEADDYTIPGRRFSYKTSPEKILSALQNGEKIKYKPSSDPDEAVKELVVLDGLSRKVGGEVQIKVDEAHQYVSKELNMLLDDARGHNIRYTLITQYIKRLQNINKYGEWILNTIDDTGEFIVFSVSDKAQGFFDYYEMPYQKVQRMTEPEYSFVRMRNNEVVSQQPERIQL
jgi:hypothetical protein